MKQAMEELEEHTALPRRDWVLLPAVSLITIGIMLLLLKVVADRLTPPSYSNLHDCLIITNPPSAVRGIPNSVCRQSTPETGLVEYKFNSCGHRAGHECAPKDPNTFRIVTTGSSVTFGLWVPQQDTFPARLPGELSALTGRKIEVYNEGMYWGFAASVAARMDEVLAAKPDMILWTISAVDIGKTFSPGTSAENVTPGLFAKTKYEFRKTLGHDSLWAALRSVPLNMNDDLVSSKPIFAIRRVLYLSPSIYLGSINDNDDDDRMLSESVSPRIQKYIQQFETYTAEIAEKAKTAGVPLVVVFVPGRERAAMIATGGWPQGSNPFRLDEELKKIVTQHGATYLQIQSDYQSIANPERGYFTMDGHPNAEGHAVFAKLIAKELTSGTVPELAAAGHPKLALKQDSTK